MLGKGNGRPEICVSNLLNIIRSEVPYSRMKGIDSKYIDKASGQVAASLRADAEWMIKTYEPRVNLGSLNIESVLAQSGDFILAADVSIKETT